MPIAIIAAVSENGVIGVNNKLPWNIPEDLKRFRALTSGHPVIMGRKTFESIGRILPHRLNVIISRQNEFSIPGATVVSSLDSAIRVCGEGKEIFVIGGAAIYAQALPLVSRLYLTIVKKTFEGDTYFPQWDRNKFREVSCERRSEPIPHEYCVFERV